ncbi:hypothetical protein [Nocardia sp. NPDC052112]|uniref:hypothetical protein n=1 Tax=Nocardia sp. NPDC052112 TaxID=3155646 RepID=UPI0034241315
MSVQTATTGWYRHTVRTGQFAHSGFDGDRSQFDGVRYEGGDQPQGAGVRFGVECDIGAAGTGGQSADIRDLHRLAEFCA